MRTNNSTRKGKVVSATLNDLAIGERSRTTRLWLATLTLLALTACGEHSFLGESSSGSGGGNSSSEEGGEGDYTRGSVGPLLQTTWSQNSPFKNMLPEGHRSFCNLVAISQMLKYYEYPAHGIGQSEPYTLSNGVEIPSVNFEATNYEWDKMLNSYRSNGSDSNEEQRKAVAELIYHAGVARGRDFITGNNKNSFSVVYTKFFGYDKSIQRLERRFYTDTEWETIIREQLDADLPVQYYGDEPGTDHTFIVDGYDNAGKFHINWGWGGSRDGWYSLDNFYYSDTRHWYNNHYIHINIMPDRSGAPSPYKLALTEFTASKTSVPQNELFTVTARINNTATLDIFPGGQAGVALVDNDGNIKAVVGVINYNALNAGSTRTSTINCFVSETVNPGQYNLRMVTKVEGEDWKSIELSAIRDGVPNAIPITVTSGVANGGGYGIVLENFESQNNAVRGESFTVTVKPRNRSGEAFRGQIGVALVDDNGEIEAVIGTGNISLAAGNQLTSNRTCTIPNTVGAGEYRLMIVARPGNNSDNNEWRKVTMSIDGVPASIDFEVK